MMCLHMHTLLICLFLMFSEPSLYKMAALQGNPTDSSTPVGFNVRQAGNENVGGNIMFYFEISSSVGPWPAGKLPITAFIKNIVDGHKKCNWSQILLIGCY